MRLTATKQPYYGRGNTIRLRGWAVQDWLVVLVLSGEGEAESLSY
jgi:hypothetical protein